MPYLLGLLLCIALPGLVLTLLQPKILKKILGRAFTKTRGVILCSLMLLVVAILAVYANNSAPDTTQTTTPQSLTISANDNTGPTDGPLQYTILNQPEQGKPLSGRISVVTSERRTDRLISLNDTILETFKNNKNTDGATSYFIDYFDEESVAKDYFTVMADRNTPVEKKRDTAFHYVAVYMHQQSSRKLLRIATGVTLKQY